jgi:hypothetical protein
MKPTIMIPIHLNYQKSFPINPQVKPSLRMPVYPLQLIKFITHHPEIVKKYNPMPNQTLTANHHIQNPTFTIMIPITVIHHHRHLITCPVQFHLEGLMLHSQTLMMGKIASLPRK